MQRTLIVIGVILVVLGIAWPWLGSTPLGRLPSDIVIERDNFTFYLPITTMVLVSAVISLVIWLFRQ